MGSTAMGHDVRATWMRGGTSKCWLFARERLPGDPADRDRLISRVFGSPDARQIDGVGGATSTTSKVMVVDEARSGSGRVEYEFGQVVVEEPRVEWTSNCGNCATALALYAAQQGYGMQDGEQIRVQLVNTRTDLVLDAAIALRGAEVPNSGDAMVPGVTHPGVPVRLEFGRESWTSKGGSIMPTGVAREQVMVGSYRATASVIDAGTPAVFVDGADLDLHSGADGFEEQLTALVDPLRDARRDIQGRVARWATDLGEAIPKIGVVVPAASGSNVDVIVRMLSMDKLHPAIGITSAVAVAAASAIEESVVATCLGDRAEGPKLRIGTAAGAVDVIRVRDDDAQLVAVEVVRSARRIADARIHLPSEVRASEPGWSAR